MADERTRYSDAELEEFRQLILKKLEKRACGLRAAARHDHPYRRQRYGRHIADVQGAGGGRCNSFQRGKRSFGCPSDEIYPQPRNGARTHREQDVRHLQNDRKAHSQGAADESAPRHGMHRGQRGPQIRRGRDDPHSTLNGKWKKTTFGPSFSSSPGEGVAAKKREGWKTPIISHAGSCTRRRDGIIGIWVSNPQFRPLCRTFCRKNPLSLTQCSPGSAYFP